MSEKQELYNLVSHIQYCKDQKLTHTIVNIVFDANRKVLEEFGYKLEGENRVKISW